MNDTAYTWTEVNDLLRTADEAQCLKLLEAERNGLRRAQFLLRIYGRYNVLRGTRERNELFQVSKGEKK